MELTQLIEQIHQASKSVSLELGYNHSEQTYQNALEVELQQRNLSYERQPNLPIYYKGRNVGFHRPDLIIDQRIIVELKVSKTEKICSYPWESQLYQYVKENKNLIGMLVIFTISSDQVYYIIIDQTNLHMYNKSTSLSLQSIGIMKGLNDHLQVYFTDPKESDDNQQNDHHNHQQNNNNNQPNNNQLDPLPIRNPRFDEIVLKIDMSNYESQKFISFDNV